MSPASRPQNDLLAALSQSEWERWQPRLEPVALGLGDVVCESGARMSHVLFPCSAIVSLYYVLETGASVGIAMVGREGVVGISLFMGGYTTPSRAVVQSAGQGLRLPTGFLMSEFDRAGPAMHLLLRYTQALITQAAQTAVCNRQHVVAQQLCRWLLFCLDRLQGDEIFITQEDLAHLIGVRREGVAEAAAHLQADGCIRYRRGHVTVIDRKALERRACECYSVVTKEYGRLLPRTDGG